MARSDGRGGRGFEDASLDVAQVLLARPGADGPAQLPLRPWWQG